MEELTKTDLTLLFDEEIYLIKEDTISEKAHTEEKQATTVEEPTADTALLAYKGGNAKQIAIITNDAANEFLSTTDETLLLNILKAIGLSLEDVAIVNHHNSGTEWQKQLDFTKAIVFGVDPITYELPSAKYTIHNDQQNNWLFSDSLADLASDKLLKGKLWGRLQELFKNS